MLYDIVGPILTSCCSFLGLGVLYLVIAAIYWLCIDRTLGVMMVFIALIVTWVNQFTKLAASFPRPFWYVLIRIE